MTPFVPRSIILGSAEPQRLRRWYREVLGATGGDSGPLHLGDFVVVVEERAELPPRNEEPGRLLVNFHVDDMDDVERRLDAAGVTWVARPEERGSGRFGTFTDPDGTYLQVIQFAAAP